MLNITIDREKTIVENPDYRINGTRCPIRWTLKTDLFFGDVYETEKENFPDFEADKIGDYICEYVIGGITGEKNDDPKLLFGLREIGVTFHDLIRFIDGKSIISPTLKDIEEMRIAYRMTANYLPSSILEKDGMRFEGLKSATEVMIAYLYYCAYNELRLVRCKHCGKWFATKSLKNQYCNRVSPCFGIIIKGKEPLHCEQAVRNIMQNCGRIKNRIETKAATARRGGDNSYMYAFARKCDKFYIDAKKEPSVSNLQRYYCFLKETEKSKGWLSPNMGGLNHG